MGLTVEETLTAMTLNAAASVGEATARARSSRASAPTSSSSTRPSLEHLVYHWGVNLGVGRLAGGERVRRLGGDLLGSPAS